MAIKFHPSVFDDVQNAYSWYESKTSGLGNDLINEIEAAYTAIENMPKAWPLIDKSLHRFILKRFPYSIIYSQTEKSIFVLCVMHLHRRPGYWQERL